MRKHIIYLASGSSRRFGGNKLLHMLDGKPMFLHGLETLRRVCQGDPECTLTVVSRYGEIRQAAEALGARAVDCPRSELGVSHSIRAGLNAIAPIGAEDYVLFCVADQPYLTAESVRNLLSLSRAGVEGATLCRGDTPGNPNLFSAALVPELLALEGDTGGRRVLRRHACEMVQAGDARELEDIDAQSP